MRIAAESLRRRASESLEISHWVENTFLTESELLQMYFDDVNIMLEDDDDAFPPDFDEWATIQLASQVRKYVLSLRQSRERETNWHDA